MTPDEILEQMILSGHATGIDISKWNVSIDIPPEVMDAIDFMDIRLSVGYSGGGVGVDPKVNSHYSEMVEHPHIVRIGYSFLSKFSSWTRQYDAFLEAIDGKEFEGFEADAEHHAIYNDIVSNPRDAERFAGIVFYFLTQIEHDFPQKRAILYTNYPTYVIINRYYDFSRFALHHAQFPYSYWYGLSEHLLPAFRQWIVSVFLGQWQPTLPLSRPQNAWDIWQLADKTGLGYELGTTGSDNIDINISNKTLGDFQLWSGLYNRWQPKPEAAPDFKHKANQIKRLLRLAQYPNVPVPK